MLVRIIGGGAVLFTLQVGVQAQANWEVVEPSGSLPVAVGCSRPDVLGDSVCIAVEAGPKVWMFGDRDALWDSVAVSVDDGEVFVVLRPWGSFPALEDAEADRLIEDMMSGSQAFVSAGNELVVVEMSGGPAVIAGVLDR